MAELIVCFLAFLGLALLLSMGIRLIEDLKPYKLRRTQGGDA